MAARLVSAYQAVNYRAFLSGLALKVVNVPNLVAERAIKEVVIEFCRETDVWWLEYEITPVAGTEFYDLPVSADHSPVKLLAAQQENNPSIAVGADVVMQNPRQFYLSDKVASNTAPVVLKVAVRPSESATTVSAQVFEQDLDAITDGAAARLMLMPQQAWTDLRLGSARGQEFTKGKRNARRRMLNEFAAYQNPTRRPKFY